MMTVREVADELAVHINVVYQLIKSGELAVHRIGPARHAIRITREDLDRYLESTRQETDR